MKCRYCNKERGMSFFDWLFKTPCFICWYNQRNKELKEIKNIK